MPSMRSLWRRLLPTGPSRGYNRCVWRPMRDNSVVPEPQGQGKVAILVAISVSIVLLSILPRLNGCKAGRTELGDLHHYGRRMTFTGGKRSSAVLAACEKRRSGLAPSTTQGHGTKTGSSIFGMPDHQTPRAASVSALAVWTVAACLLERCRRAGAVLSISLIHFGT